MAVVISSYSQNSIVSPSITFCTQSNAHNILATKRASVVLCQNDRISKDFSDFQKKIDFSDFWIVLWIFGDILATKKATEYPPVSKRSDFLGLFRFSKNECLDI